MRDLRLIGVHDDGEHLVVTDDAGEEYRLRIDEPLRAAARRDRPRLGQLQIAIDNDVRPREVQAMIRAGASADEVAARTGWDLDKIARFEGPVLAEREHIATRAQGVRLRGTNQAGSPETLAQRAATRFTGRGVEPSSVLWDASRNTEGQWTVSAAFAAGGRERTATWWFDVAGMSVVAKNDEAKWLSEADTPAGPVPTAVHRPTAVFDVEVEETKVERASRANTDDLINSMREHSGAKSRRRGGARRKSRAAEPTPAVTEDALPIDELPPPASGTHPQDDKAQGTTVQDEKPMDDKPKDDKPKDEPARAGAPAPKAAAAPVPAAAQAPSRTATAQDSPPEAPSAATTDDVEVAAAPAAEMKAEHEPDAQPVDTTQDDAESDDLPEDQTTEPGPGESTASEPEQSDAEQPEPEQSDAEQSDKDSSGKGRGGRKGRAKVPSWDDVMFGTTRD